MTGALRDGLAQLLIDAVDGGASVGFLAPLAAADADAYWQGVIAALGPGLALWVAEEQGRVIGAVQLAPCLKANGRHRGDVQKLFVLAAARGRGLASKLMAALEAHAVATGLTLLVLDTEIKSLAERVYGHLGWQRSGEIPGYALTPCGTPYPTVYWFKVLPPPG